MRIGKHDCQVCSFEHLLNLLWHPVIEYLEALSENAAPKWTKSLGLNQAAILSEMHGLVAQAEETLEMDLWIEFIQKTLQRLLKVHVPTRLILQVVSHIFPLSMQPTPANALHLLRSSLCERFVGPALAAQVNRMVLSEIAGAPVKLIPEEKMNLDIRKDFIYLERTSLWS